MALRGFRCSECHTWFEGEGNHPKCPLCGKRASPRDLIAQRPDRTQAQDAFPPPGYESQPDFDVPSREVPDYRAPEWDVEPAPPASEPEPQPTADAGQSWGDRMGPLIGAIIFVAIIASRICSELTNPE